MGSGRHCLRLNKVVSEKRQFLSTALLKVMLTCIDLTVSTVVKITKCTMKNQPSDCTQFQVLREFKEIPKQQV